MKEVNKAEFFDNKALKALKWNYLASVLPKFASPIVLILLARILTPEDYGLIATSTIITSLAYLLTSSGLSEAIIQINKKNYASSINFAFWANLLITIILYLIVFIASPFLSDFFNEPRLSLILKVHGLIILFSGWSVIPIGILKRNFDFKKISYLSFIPVIINFSITLPLAYFGLKYWALIIGAVAANAIQFLIYLVYARFIPSFSIKVDTGILIYSMYVMIDGILGWVFSYLDTAIIAKYLSISSAGIYFFAKNLINLSFGTLIMPIFTLIFAYFSRLFEYERNSLAKKLSSIIRTISIVVFPMIILSFFSAENAISFVFSGKWDAAIPVLKILLLTQISWLFMPFPEIFKAIGKPRLLLTVNILQGFFAVMIFYFTASIYGLIVFCYARLSLSWIFIFHIYYAKKYLLYTSFYKDIQRPLFISIVVSLLLLITNLISDNVFYSGNNHIYILGITIFIGLLSYIILILKYMPNDVLRLKRLILKL